MSNPVDSVPSYDPRVRALQESWARRRARFFVTFAFVEGGLLALAGIVVFVLKLVDPEIGQFIIIAVLVLGGAAMMFGILSMQRAYQRDLRDITG